MHPPEIRLPIALLVLLVGLLPAHALADPPYISEIMTRNDGTILDADGDASDWIEVYNPGPQAVNLSGWSLTDETARPTKWRFPIDEPSRRERRSGQKLQVMGRVESGT